MKERFQIDNILHFYLVEINKIYLYIEDKGGKNKCLLFIKSLIK